MEPSATIGGRSGILSRACQLGPWQTPWSASTSPWSPLLTTRGEALWWSLDYQTCSPPSRLSCSLTELWGSSCLMVTMILFWRLELHLTTRREHCPLTSLAGSTKYVKTSHSQYTFSSPNPWCAEERDQLGWRHSPDAHGRGGHGQTGRHRHMERPEPDPRLPRALRRPHWLRWRPPCAGEAQDRGQVRHLVHRHLQVMRQWHTFVTEIFLESWLLRGSAKQASMIFLSRSFPCLTLCLIMEQNARYLRYLFWGFLNLCMTLICYPGQRVLPEQPAHGSSECVPM